MSTVQSLKHICDRIDAMNVTVIQAEASEDIETGNISSNDSDGIRAIKDSLTEEGFSVPDIIGDVISIELTRGITLKISKKDDPEYYCVCELSLEAGRFNTMTDILDIDQLFFLMHSLNEIFHKLKWEYNSPPPTINAFELENDEGVHYDDVSREIHDKYGTRNRVYVKGIKMFYTNKINLLLQITPSDDCCFFLRMAGTDKWRKTYVQATHHKPFRSLIMNLDNVDMFKWK